MILVPTSPLSSRGLYIIHSSIWHLLKSHQGIVKSELKTFPQPDKPLQGILYFSEGNGYLAGEAET